MISIVIPVFNAHTHIIECYNSLISQTFKDWEAVFIDDGSNDSSFEILSTLSQTDSRVKVFHQENKGVAVAREIGIKNALGEFITFLDVDDTFESNALEHYVAHLSKDSDIVVGGINLVSERGKIIKTIQHSLKTISGESAVSDMCTGVLPWQLCGKAYKTSLFIDVLTPYGLRRAEDMAVCLQATLNAKRVNVIRECLYNYIQVSTSVTHAKEKEIFYDDLKSAEFVQERIGKKVNEKIDCLFLLLISNALRGGITSSDKIFKQAAIAHGNFKTLSKIPYLKALNVCLYRFFSINLARFIKI